LLVSFILTYLLQGCATNLETCKNDDLNSLVDFLNQKMKATGTGEEYLDQLTGVRFKQNEEQRNTLIIKSKNGDVSAAWQLYEHYYSYLQDYKMSLLWLKYLGGVLEDMTAKEMFKEEKAAAEKFLGSSSISLSEKEMKTMGIP